MLDLPIIDFKNQLDSILRWKESCEIIELYDMGTWGQSTVYKYNNHFLQSFISSV